MLVIATGATAIALASTEILRLVQLPMAIVAASGFVILLRWFWWRVNGRADGGVRVVVRLCAALPGVTVRRLGLARDRGVLAARLVGAIERDCAREARDNVEAIAPSLREVAAAGARGGTRGD